MSAPAPTSTAVTSGPTAGGPTRPLRRAVGWWVLVGAALVVAVIVVASTRSGPADTAALGPANPKADGARALVRVLDDHGVDVHVVRDRAAFDAQRVGADTTVVVAPSSRLSRSTAADVLRHARDAGSIVVAGVAAARESVLDLPVDRAPVVERDAPSTACELAPVDGLRLTPSGRLGTTGFRAETDAIGHGCFPVEDESGHRRYALWQRPASGYPDVWLVGDPGTWTNADITRGDDAAIALRLLGRHPRVVWYVPDVADVPVGDAGSVRSVLPRGLFPGLFVVAAALLAFMLARGRRLGRLVFEPLPVTVRAIESTLGRGRLYRCSGDRGHAAAVLRRATRVRLRVVLKQPPDAPPAVLYAAVAAATGDEPGEVAALLDDTGLAVVSDTMLAELARALLDLEREVRLT